MPGLDDLISLGLKIEHFDFGYKYVFICKQVWKEYVYLKDKREGQLGAVRLPDDELKAAQTELQLPHLGLHLDTIRLQQ